jgi:hypothetical protein
MTAVIAPVAVVLHPRVVVVVPAVVFLHNDACRTTTAIRIAQLPQLELE